jgi:hypothetical protein
MDARPIHSTTENISSGGLFFFSSTAFEDGEALHCQISLPNEVARPLGQAASLECEMRVLRSELRSDERYGIACEMRKYRVRAVADGVIPQLQPG